jgi:hypothetical protein
VIDFRYHVISIVAIFLALATGIALGAGPLGSRLSDGLVGQFNRSNETVEEQRVQLTEAERVEDFNEAFANGVDTRVLEGLLTGSQVTVFTLPEADNRSVERVVDALQMSGAQLVAEVAVSPALLDPVNRTTAENLSTQVLEGVEGVPTVDEVGSYEVVGYAIAQGLLATAQTGTPVDITSEKIQSAFETAEYLTYEGEITRRGGLAVVVAGEPDPETDVAAGEILTALMGSMDTLSGGVVLAGPLSSTVEGGPVRTLRDSDVADNVSSVDMVDTPAGQVITAIALAEQAAGDSGHYGIGEAADQVVPEIPTLAAAGTPPGE